MRTSKYYKLLASIVLVSTITISSNNVFAQRRAHKEESTRYDERRRNKPLHDYNKRDRYKKSTYTYKDDRKSNKHDYRSKHKKSHHKKHDTYAHKKHHKHHKYHGHKKYHKHSHVEHRYYRGDHYKGHHKYHHKHRYPYYRYKHYYNKFGHSCYNHSRYGEVIWRFAHEPRVIHHHDGDYYFSDGCYYRYYPEFGFVHVDVPDRVYFSHLPDDCHRVRLHGEVYYTDGDLCFVRHRKGFRLISAPSGIHFSLRF